MISHLFLEIAFAIPYFFVGLLIGYIARRHGRFYAIGPGLLIGAEHIITPILLMLPSVMPPVAVLLAILHITVVLTISFLGGLVGELIKSRTTRVVRS